MKMVALIFGLLLVVATLIWFFYLVPLGCGMNPTGCRERFDVFSMVGLVNFWAPLAVAGGAIIYGSSRR